MSQWKWEDQHEVRADPALHAEVTGRHIQFQRDVEGEPPPHSGRDPGWLTTDGFWAVLDVPRAPETGALDPDADVNFTDGVGRYSFMELFAHESQPGAFPVQDTQQGTRQGTLSAVEMTARIDVPFRSVVWMTWSEHLGGGGYRFRFDGDDGGVGFPGGSGSGDGGDGGGGGGGGPGGGRNCHGVSLYRYECRAFPGGVGASAYKLAELVGKLERDPLTGCESVRSWAFSRFLPVCCECAGDPPTCDPCVGTVSTLCCPAVPCDLCLVLAGPGACVPVAVTLTYDADDPVEVNGQLVCGWGTAAAFYLGTCRFTASLVCVGKIGALDPVWELRLREDTGLDPGADISIILGRTFCSPFQLFGTIAGAEGCCGTAGPITITVTAAPCAAACPPLLSCDVCPTGQPRSYFGDFSAIALLDPAGFGDVTGVITLVWRGGCTWAATLATGTVITLIFDRGAWALIIQDVSGALRATGAPGFDCCAGGTFADWAFGGTEVPVTLFRGDDCCGGGGGGSGGPCCDCPVVPLQWSFTAAGVTNGTCVACAGYNAAWTITLVPGTCSWMSGALTDPCTPGPAWTLSCDATDWQLLTSNFGGAARYTKSRATFNCLASNVLTRVADHTPGCDGFPATITIVPV